MFSHGAITFKPKAGTLRVEYRSSSVVGLNSVTTLIIGSQSAVLVDPPFLVPDAKEVVLWIKSSLNQGQKLHAIWCTHHHPDHYLSANPILDAFPEASFLTAAYVRAGIDREYDEKRVFWPKAFGADKIPEWPAKPEVYPYSLMQLPGDASSPIVILGPIVGDTVDHATLWLPTEKIFVAGDALYGRTTSLWTEEIESPQLLKAWRAVLDLVESLEPDLVVVGHIEQGTELNAEADLQHNREYLNFFESLGLTKPESERTLTPKQIWDKFVERFPHCKENLDFLLGKPAEMFGKGGTIWEENRLHKVYERTEPQLTGYILGQRKWEPKRGEAIGNA